VNKEDEKWVWMGEIDYVTGIKCDSEARRRPTLASGRRATVP
jgi:hypothetical protein